MTNISQVADRIGGHICKGAGLEAELKKVCFGIEVMMVMSVSIAAMLAVGGMFGIFEESLIITITAFLMKFIIGGPHLSGFFRCLIYSTALMLGGALLANLYQLWLTIPIALLLLLLNFLLILFVRLTPSYRTFNKAQTLRRKALAAVLVLVSVVAHLEYFHLWSAGALIGFSISILNISPAGINFVKWLDLITKQGGADQ